MAQRILIVRYAALGDCIMSAWPVAALRADLKDASITWAIQPRCADVVSSRLARVRIVPREGKRSHGLLPMLRFYAGLRKERFDVGFDFQGHTKTALALRLARPKKRFSARATDHVSRALTPPLSAPEELKHYVERELWLVRQWRSVASVERPPMPEPIDLPNGIVLPERFISIQTGAGSAHKAYPLELWQEAARQLLAQGVPLAAIGGPADKPLEGALNLAGRLSVGQSLTVVSRSAVHLAADTGTGHAAAAYGVPLVSVFGPEKPSKCRPYTQKMTLLHKGLATSDNTPEDVAAAAMEWWEKQ